MPGVSKLPLVWHHLHTHYNGLRNDTESIRLLFQKHKASVGTCSPALPLANRVGYSHQKGGIAGMPLFAHHLKLHIFCLQQLFQLCVSWSSPLASSKFNSVLVDWTCAEFCQKLGVQPWGAISSFCIHVPFIAGYKFIFIPWI